MISIALIIATRGHPHRAAAVMESALSLAGERHRVTPIISCDADDPKTYNYFKREYPGVRLVIGERPKGLGAAWNRAIYAFDNAQFYIPMVDDSFIASPYWDEIINSHMVNNCFKPRRCLALVAAYDLANQGQCTLPIMSREWIALNDDKIFDDRFPFWFFDTCVAETYSFVTGKHLPILQHVVLAARKGKTARMRDLAFWWSFYVATRQERLAKAAEIRKVLGIDLSASTVTDRLREWEQRDARMSNNFDEIERELAGQPGQVTHEYFAAKADAENYMKTISEIAA